MKDLKEGNYSHWCSNELQLGIRNQEERFRRTSAGEDAWLGRPKDVRRFKPGFSDSVSVSFPSYLITLIMNLSSMYDFNEAEIGMMNDVTKRLRKSQRDIIEIQQAQSTLHSNLANNIKENISDTSIIGSIVAIFLNSFEQCKETFSGALSVYCEVTQEIFNNDRIYIIEAFDCFKQYNSYSKVLCSEFLSLFDVLSMMHTEKAQKSVLEHKFEEVEASRKVIDIISSEKTTFTSCSESFHAHLNETYANAETILKTLSNGDMSCLPPVSVVSRVSRKRWRDDLQELEKVDKVPTYLNSALKLLKCLISDAALSGTQYIAIATDTSGSINVFYDYVFSAIRLDNEWLDATTQWPPAEKSLQSDYLNRIKSIGIEAADVLAFKKMYSCDIGTLKIEQALVQSGYQVGYTTIRMQSNLVDEESFRAAIGSDAISAEKLGGPVIGRFNHIHNYNNNLWYRFTNANPSFNTYALVINLWSHNGKPLELAADIHFCNRLYPFETGKTHKKFELPYFYIKPNLSNLQLASDGSWTENAVKVFDKDTFDYPHFRNLIANKKYDHIELLTVFKSDISYTMDKISWVSPEAIGVTYKSNEGSKQTE